MSRCSKCGIDILDNTQKCPLCHCVTDTDQNADVTPTETYSGMYPNISSSIKMVRFAERLVLFLSITTLMVLALVNILWKPFVVWTILVGLILLYVNAVFRMSVTGRVGYQFKTVIMTFMSVGILIGIDALTGYRGWSLNVMLPAAVLFLNLAIFLLIFINMRNWQSYIPLEVFLMLLSAVLVILSVVGVITYPNIVYIAAAVSVTLFTGTVIFGGERAKNELYRRFHI